MAGKWHIDAGDPMTRALPFGRLVQAYTQGYEGPVVTEPALLADDPPGIDAWQQGQADAAAGLNPGFTAEVAPEPPPPEPPPERHARHSEHKGHKK